jgi:MFS transporter, putative metabolite:H+ symporter
MVAIRTLFQQRRNVLAFWAGCAAVSGGVLAHLPMFLMGRNTHYVLAGMPMDAGMIAGMFAIVAGIILAGYGLLPAGGTAAHTLEPIAPPEDAPLTARHWIVAGLVALALVIDIMKPASLGFVTPGMRTEYALDSATTAWLPFAALAGTAVGSVVWGALADLYGRRGSILLSSVMFIGTSICGAMPSFWWNVGMCFLMGAAAGGMLPVACALLAEIMPTRHRGWSLVLIGSIGAVGGYFAASGCSALLQPTFGWRILWLLNFPTGLALVLMSPLLPESARFLQQMGRADEARAVLARFGVAMGAAAQASHPPPAPARPRPPSHHRPHPLGISAALTLSALVYSLINFGLLLWLPSSLVAEGHSVSQVSALIARSTLIALPVVLASTWLYSAWSTKGSLLLMIGMTICGLLGVGLRGTVPAVFGSITFDLTLLIIGTSGMIAILLPYTSESFPLRIRGRVTGGVASCSKLGGLLAQTLGVLGATPALSAAALGIGLPALVALLLLARYGPETCRRDLREIELEWSDDTAPPLSSARAGDLGS